MSVFKDFETKVIRLLVGKHLPESDIDEVLASSIVVKYEHTGVGYFLTVSHAVLPTERVVCDTPLLVGATSDVQCGFVVFLEGGELTLECHSWGDAAIAKDLRESHVEVTIKA